jgi:SARP family transcriptional regulator, regulator of embCAB operon
MTTEINLHVLGQVRADCGGREVALGGAQRRALLALLVLNLNRVVDTSAIAEVLWHDRTPSDVAASIHVAVSGLRTAFATASPAADPEVAITRVASGYRIAAPTSRSDLARFAAARDAGMHALAGGRADLAAEHLRSALAQWSGHALEDVSGPRLEAAATALEGERLDALEARIEADLQLGRHALVVGELAALTQEVPLRESVWAKHMLALYRCGRQAEALEVYGHVRTMLRDELGIAPEQTLVTLHGRILRQDPTLDLDPGPVRGASAIASTERGDSTLPEAKLLGPDGRIYPVGDGLSLGRLSGSTIQIDDPLVSRLHATIRATARGYVLADLQSTNGTYVNGALLLEPVQLTGGEIIRIASSTFVFRQAEP